MRARGSLSGRATLHSVAAAAGVSHQTVSRVLNGMPKVSAATRARVLDAVRELGYRPNSAARALVTGRSRTLGVLSTSGTLSKLFSYARNIPRNCSRKSRCSRSVRSSASSAPAA